MSNVDTLSPAWDTNTSPPRRGRGVIWAVLGAIGLVVLAVGLSGRTEPHTQQRNPATVDDSVARGVANTKTGVVEAVAYCQGTATVIEVVLTGATDLGPSIRAVGDADRGDASTAVTATLSRSGSGAAYLGGLPAGPAAVRIYRTGTTAPAAQLHLTVPNC